MLYLFYSSFVSLAPYWQQPDTDIFGPSELAELNRLKVQPRINEWRASRLAAKLLIREVIPDLNNLPLSSVRVQKEPSGLPYLFVENSGRIPGSFSLSHSQGFVLIAFCAEISRLGVDLEFVEPRSETFAWDYFTQSECSLIQSHSTSHYPLLENLLWSAKESILKAAGLGLNQDTRKVQITGFGDPEAYKDWQLMEFDSPDLPFVDPRLFWRVESCFVQTVCLDAKKVPEFHWVTIRNQS
jgi:phosphopantetheinyl transferase